MFPNSLPVVPGDGFVEWVGPGAHIAAIQALREAALHKLQLLQELVIDRCEVAGEVRFTCWT